MTFTILLVHGLAVWRISSLLVREEGPFRIFVRLRELTGIQHDADWRPWVIPDRFFAQLLGCIWCASLWVGFIFAVLFLTLPEFSFRMAIVFSFSTLAILLDRLIKPQ